MVWVKKIKLEEVLTNRRTGVQVAKEEVIDAFLINGGRDNWYNY
jgi:hypothetical protein